MSVMSWGSRSGFAVGGAVTLLGLLGVAAQASPPTEGSVRLLFPILTGREYGLLKAVAPQATIVEINGAAYVQVASFSNDQVAYELGRSIQREIRIPFDLAVIPSSPEAIAPQTRPPAATLREGSRDETGLATTATRSPLPLEAAAAAQTTPARKDPGVNSFAPAATPVISIAPTSTRSQIGRSRAEIFLPTQSATHEQAGIPGATSSPIANIREAAAPAVPPQAKDPNPKQAETGDATPTAAIRSNATEPPTEPTSTSSIPSCNPNSEQAKPTLLPHSTNPASTSPGANTPSEPTEPTSATVIADYIAGCEQAAARPTTAPDVRTDTNRSTRSHADARLGTAPLASVALGLPVIRSVPAPNRSIDYLFVRLRQPADIQKLIGIAQVTEVFAAGETLLARVGVFTRSSKGQQLLHSRIRGLRHHRLELLVARGGEPQAIS